MVSVGMGSLFYFGERILFGCRGLVAEAHSHYAVSILISLDHPFRIQNLKGDILECESIIISPNFYHTLYAENVSLIVLQFDPKSADYQSLKKALGNQKFKVFSRDTFTSHLKNLSALLTGNLDCATAQKLYYQILNCISPLEPKQFKFDVRVQTALTMIQEILPNSIRVQDLSKKIGISEDRFMHWFKEQFGLPLRQYLLWRRLHLAARLLQTGTNLTDASHAAGFSDQSHFSKTFRKMFGVPPSRFLGGNENFRVCFCTDSLS